MIPKMALSMHEMALSIHKIAMSMHEMALSTHGTALSNFHGVLEGQINIHMYDFIPFKIKPQLTQVRKTPLFLKSQSPTPFNNGRKIHLRPPNSDRAEGCKNHRCRVRRQDDLLDPTSRVSFC